MLQDTWNVLPGLRPSTSAPPSPGKPTGMNLRPTTSAPSSPAKPIGLPRTRSDSFHVTHKVPVGDTPYVKAKNVQLVDKDPERAIPLFWAAINAGDRVDSALKDMAIVMKQQNRAEEAIEAIKSLRNRCSDQAQESLDNILLDLFKRCGRLDDQITLLRHKLFLIQQGMAFNGKRTKTARSQGKKFQVSVAQEATRLLGNLGWALMQQNKYVEAEDAYRRALLMAPDNNKMCNLGICLMKQGRIVEAKETLRMVKPAVADGPRGVDSHLKAFERARQMLADLESEMLSKGGADPAEQRRLFDAFLASSSLWQPQPCKDHHHHHQQQQQINKPQDEFGDENIDTANNRGGGPIPMPMPMPMNHHDHQKSRAVYYPEQKMVNNKARAVQANGGNSLNVGAMPFYSSKMITSKDPMQESLKRTRSGHAANSVVGVGGGGGGGVGVGGGETGLSWKPLTEFKEPENKARRQSFPPEEDEENWADLLPDSEEFEAALIGAVLGSSSATETPPPAGKKKNSSAILHNSTSSRLKVFQDITLSMSPRA